ncbi:MAG: hypothetical protein WCI03_14210 [bacterium]
MATRPVFIVQTLTPPSFGVVVEFVDFLWSPGMARSQKQKCIDSLHVAIKKQHQCNPLEISSKSRTPLGVDLSAFNLSFRDPSGRTVSVESAFQGSKVFRDAGPFHALYGAVARDAKGFFKDKMYGPLKAFNFYGKIWPTRPKTIFYDWIYLNFLFRNPPLASSILKYDAFTDIEFNPKRSINCQAFSAALFVALSRAGQLDAILKDRAFYIETMRSLPEWIDGTSFAQHHELSCSDICKLEN